jgi:hypothetical protein
MPKKLSYISIGRGGHVLYEDAAGKIKLEYEFGGGDCVAIIFVPSPAAWVLQTNRAAQERNVIIEFVAQQALKDQVSNGYYKISDNYIELFKK